MTKKKSQSSSEQEQSETLPKVNFNFAKENVFTTRGDTIFIGGQPIDNALRGTLKDEALYIDKSRFWELLSATIIQESADMALLQSAEWNHVLSAKMLHHWMHVMRNMLHALKK